MAPEEILSMKERAVRVETWCNKLLVERGRDGLIATDIYVALRSGDRALRHAVSLHNVRESLGWLEERGDVYSRLEKYSPKSGGTYRRYWLRAQAPVEEQSTPPARKPYSSPVLRRFGLSFPEGGFRGQHSELDDSFKP